MIRRPAYLMMLVLFAATAMWAAAQPTPEELDQQRRRLEAMRKHPEQLSRLRELLQSFLALPEPRRDAIEKLDHDLHELPTSKQENLWNTLQRDADWLDQLRQKDAPAYQAIKNAPDATKRLALIKDLRDREWMQTQSKSLQDQWKQQPAEARADFVTRLRQEERQRHQQWIIARRFWSELEKKQAMPSRLSDFSEIAKTDKVKKYVDEYLLPYLSAAEKKQLQDAEGRWPDFPQTLVAIASKHPSALLLSGDEEKPRVLTQLPVPIQHRVTDKKGVAGKSKLLPKLDPYKGTFNFASKVVEFGTKDGKVPFEHEFWPCNYKSLLPPMKEFVDKKLIPALKDNADKKALLDNEGKWPYYPQTIQELAKKHNLQPPWHILPEAERWKWDLYRDPRCRSWSTTVAAEKKGT